jgi:regulator of PEP synthase PpsR (kinase-PPPase family)
MDIVKVLKPGQRAVFFVSDRTGLTAETYGRNLLAQFPDLEFETFTLAFIGTEEKARHAVELIDTAHRCSGVQPVVFSSLMEPHLMAIIRAASASLFDLFDTFLGPLEKCLGMESAHSMGVSKQILSHTLYNDRLDAIDYCLSHDDGVRPDQYDEAQVILIGVSRCGKTPTSLYLAMNFTLKACNYPLTEEDLQDDAMPKYLQPHLSKLVGLTIKPVPLSRIRNKRRQGSDYASLANCQRELKIADSLFNRYQIPVFDTTDTSIEEIASNVVRALGISQERIGFA